MSTHTPKREEKAGRGIRTISSIHGLVDLFKRFWVWNRPADRVYSAQPTEIVIDQAGTHPQNISHISNDSPAISQSKQEKMYVPQKFPLGPFYHRPDSDESEIIKGSLICERYEDCHFKELVNSMRVDVFTSEVRAWYTRLQCPLINEEGRRQKMDLYSDDDLARMMARDGLFLLEFLRVLGGLHQRNASSFHPCRSEISANRLCNADGFFRPWLHQLAAVEEDVMKIGNQIPFFVLQNVLQWEVGTYQRDPDKDASNLVHQRQANTDQRLECILKHALLKLAPIQNLWESEDSHVTPGVSWGRDSHLLGFVYENIISSSDLYK